MQIKNKKKFLHHIIFNYFCQNFWMEKKQTIIIIGGGIGGLFCGAILSKEGYNVKIFEQHYKIGGGLHHFKREGVEFETGMHVIGTFQPG